MTAALLLEPVPARSAGVRRSRLVSALADPAAPPLTVLVAPAGFGKTTLLREWSVRDPRPFAWITLTVRHDAPSTLLRAVAAAVDDAMATTTDGRVVLVLDDVQRLHSAATHETLAAIVTDLPPTVSVALASRTAAAGPGAAPAGRRARDRAAARCAGHDALRGRGVAVRRACAARARRRRRARAHHRGLARGVVARRARLERPAGPECRGRALRWRGPDRRGVPARGGPRRALRGRTRLPAPERDPRRAVGSGLRQRPRAARVGRHAGHARAVGRPARGPGSHGRALSASPPARRPVSRRAAPHRAGARSGAPPPRQRLA